MPPKAAKTVPPKDPKEAEAKKKVEPKAKPKATEEKKRKADEAAEEPAPKEVKVVPPQVEEFEEEQDDVPDKKQKIKAEVTFLGADLTLNAIPCMGNKVLMALNEGGMQYLIAGARANVGLKGGRHMFEVKITEMYHPSEASQSRQNVRGFIRIGFSTSGSSLILGESEESVWFDNNGLFSAGKTKAPKTFTKLNKDQGVAIILNLDEKSPHANTVSIFRDGVRACKPRKLPENLIGKPLFPHVSYRHASLMVNFGKPMTKLPFTCRSVSEAATAHASVTPAPSGKYEMLMPVAFPDEGTFDWLDSFLEANPKYTELSDRKMMEWAVASGLTRPKLGLNASNDKPNYQYGVHSLDDNSLMKVVQSIPSIQPRNFVVMEVKSNLVAEERYQILKRFPGYKKVDHVVMGKHKAAYKHRVHNQILKQKQQKSDSTWRMKKAQQEQKKRILEQQKLMAEKKKEMEEKKKAEAEAKKAEEAKKAKEAKEAKEGEEGEEAAAEATEEPAAEETEAKDAEMKEEEPKAEEPKAEEEDLGDEPPQVELTEEEEKQNFIKGSIPDVSPAVLAKAFASFTVPEKSEGFDEVNYEWQGAAESKEYLRKWVLETKLTTRIEDLQPSNDFKEKYSAWQKAFTELQTKQKAWKSGGKKDGSKEGGAVDIFSVEDINDIGGGEPLYSNFEAEDWAMLQLRYEFFLLQDAFIKDVNDEDRTAIPEAHLAFYYQKYFKKAINTKQFSLSDVPELLNLIKDTVAIDEETKMFTKVLEDAESLDILVKCTEESRKERKRRIDAGDETARLKFLSHNPAPAPVPAAVPPAPAAVGLQKGKGKAMGKGKPMKGMMGKW